MNRTRRWIGLAIVWLSCAAPQALAQRDSARPAAEVGRGSNDADGEREELLGFWPTPKMVDGIVHHVVREIGRHYEFDEDQTTQMTTLVREQFVTWFQKHRRQIQPLLNEFMESQLASEAPLSENVAKWAERVVPLLDDFHTVMEGSTEEMRGFMTEDQQGQLEADLAAYNVARRLALDKIYRWKEGGFDPDTEWTGDPDERHRREREERLAAKAAIETERQRVKDEMGISPRGAGDAAGEATLAAGAEPARPPGEGSAKPIAKAEVKDEWARYVDDFIRRYDLDQSQQGQALQALARRQEKRADYLRQKARELDKTQKLIAGAESAEEKARALDELAALNKPLERIFQQLKDDLDKLPTRKQRARVAEAELRKTRSDASTPRVVEAPKSAGGGD